MGRIVPCCCTGTSSVAQAQSTPRRSHRWRVEVLVAAVGHTHGGSLAKVVALQVTLTKLLLLETGEGEINSIRTLRQQQNNTGIENDIFWSST
jgi:hypothetical protein